MKRIKLFSSLLAFGMLVGTGIPVVSNMQSTSVAMAQTVSESTERVTIQADDVDIDDGMIVKLNNEDKAQRLLDGAELYIPTELNGVIVRGIGDGVGTYRGYGVFDTDVLEAMVGLNVGVNSKTKSRVNRVTESSDIGITKLIFETPENIEFIGEYAFYGNRLTQLNLPNIIEIGYGAFQDNRLTQINLPENVTLLEEVFWGQDISINVMANKEGEVPFEAIKPQLKLGSQDQIAKINNVEILDEDTEITVSEDKLIGALMNEPMQLDLEMELEMLPDHLDTYSVRSTQLTINPYTENSGGGSSGGGGGSIIEAPDLESDNNITPPGGDMVTVSPTPDVNHPHTVYALRAMRLHKNVSLTSPSKSYKKQARAKAANFKVLGVSYDSNGKKRYKVKGGYITASSKYVADSHFRSSKVKRVRVIGKRVNSYKNVALSANQKVRSYKTGTKLTVKRIVKHGRTTRFELSNGRYITGNKQLLIMDHSK